MFYESFKNDLCEICDDAQCKQACIGECNIIDTLLFVLNIYHLLAKTAALVAGPENDNGQSFPLPSSALKNVTNVFVLLLVLFKSFSLF